jgi:hypothetical protein
MKHERSMRKAGYRRNLLRYLALAIAALLLLPALFPLVESRWVFHDASAMAHRDSLIPALVNPVNPRQFGAKCNGVTDDSKAFQAAIDAGDVLVPAGTCIIDKTVEITVSHRHLECASGATLAQTNAYAGRMFSVQSKTGEALYGNSIANCTFIGANSDVPQYIDEDARHWNIAIQTNDKVNGFVLVGNRFSRFYGQATFQTYGAIDGGHGDVIAYNEFKSCGYYGPVFVAHRDGYMGHNVLTDCAIGVENDNAGQMTGGNVIEYNTVTAVHGYGAPDMHASALLTGGAAGDADYSGNIVRYNLVRGKSSAAQRNGRPSLIYQKAPGRPAQYLRNECIAGCSVIR